MPPSERRPTALSEGNVPCLSCQGVHARLVIARANAAANVDSVCASAHQQNVCACVRNILRLTTCVHVLSECTTHGAIRIDHMVAQPPVNGGRGSPAGRHSMR